LLYKEMGMFMKRRRQPRVRQQKMVNRKGQCFRLSPS